MNILTRSIILFSLCMTMAAAGWTQNQSAAATGTEVVPAKIQIPGSPASAAITDAQKAQLRELSSRYQSTIAPLTKQYNAEQRVLDGLIHAQAIDEAAIRAQVGKISAIRVDFALQRAHYLHDMRAVLTKEQIQRFQQVGSEATEARLDNFLTRIGSARAAAARPAVAPAK